MGQMSAERDLFDEQLQQLVSVVREVLGERVVGAYLHGSAVLGGVRPRSDIDVLAVSSRSTTPVEKRLLVERLIAITGTTNPGPPWTVELSIVVASEVKPWRYAPRLDFQYGEWVRHAFQHGDYAPWKEKDPDLALLITIALQGDRPLLGPRPAEVFDPVPPADLTRAMVHSLDGLLGNLSTDTRNVLLTLARIQCTLATGEIRTKDRAADWVLDRLPKKDHAVLARARAIYLGEEEDRWEDLGPSVAALADQMADEIRRAAPVARLPSTTR
jgi:predicted nucleotidyltransferase